MKYRHSFHAGNFADVHKHVAVLALLSALSRKDRGFAYFETHAGRGVYDSSASPEAAAGIARFMTGAHEADELRAYARLIGDFRQSAHQGGDLPGSPLLAAHSLRSQDRAILCEIQPAEARALEHQLDQSPRMRVVRGDGFEKLRGWLPPSERRALIFIDPPYENSARDQEQSAGALLDGLQRFNTGVFAIWYPIKDERPGHSWPATLDGVLTHKSLISELWLYPRDSRVTLNGSGLLIVNPPYLFGERMQVWLPELHACLDAAARGGTSIVEHAARP
jgi:23S rRNA (adenine2030-N6)-methyltransferase